MRAILRCGFFLLSMVLIIGLVVPVGAFAEKTIKIGVIYPLTGGAAAAGRELRAGAELAAEIANNAMTDINMSMAKSAGISSLGGAKIELIFKDHEGNPTLGADLAKKLILDDKVDGILGCYFSSVTKTVSAVAEQHAGLAIGVVEDRAELLDADDEGDLVGEPGYPVDAVDERCDLGVGADFRELLVSAMHVADDRFDIDDALTVDIRDEAEHTVGRRVLRADVERHVRRLEFDADCCLRPVDHREICHASPPWSSVAGRPSTSTSPVQLSSSRGSESARCQSKFSFSDAMVSKSST